MCYCWNGKGVGEQQAERREEEGSEGQGNKMAPKCIRRTVGVVVVAPVGLGGGWVPHGLATTTTPPFPRKQAAFVSSRHAGAAHALPPTRQ